MDLFGTDKKEGEKDDQPISLEESFAEGFKIAGKKEAKNNSEKKPEKKKKDKDSELGSYT